MPYLQPATPTPSNAQLLTLPSIAVALAKASMASRRHPNPWPSSATSTNPSSTTSACNRPYRFEFYDTASPTHYTLLNPDFVLLCYDTGDQQSLENVRTNWRKKVVLQFREWEEERIPVMLIGLKRDLRDQMVQEGRAGWVDPHEG